MYCQKCGKENPDTNEFCGNCGESLLKSPTNYAHKQFMRPILWGVIGFVVGFLGWVGFNLMSLGTYLHGGPNWLVQGGTFLFLLLFLFSLPIAIVAEIIIWIYDRPEKIERDQSSPSTSKKEFPFKPNPIFIIIGIVLILSLYLLPIHTLIIDGNKTNNTTAELVTACSGVGWQCEPFSAIGFYAIWIIGLGLIIFGIFYRNLMDLRKKGKSS
jgi:hypothetical protein